ncbi:hypothetical protein CcaverHIS002_0703770 [Cutaneotrichosporon cavernicola]|nr:hypothetical protein CcaverHIS002_0703770 [Cutaneotrichosporon cavernicola]
MQRLSQESVHKLSYNSSRSSSNDGSDSSDVLAARRDELMSQLLTAEYDQDIGKWSSGEMLTRRPSTPPSSDCPVEVNIISATPSHSSTQLTEDALPRSSSGWVFTPSPPSGSTSRDNDNDDGGAHAWDSVWPAPNAQPVVSFPLQPAMASRFPSAPVSPYVTPSFSPAVVQATRRLSSSPPHSPSPRTARCSRHGVIALTSFRKVGVRELNSKPKLCAVLIAVAIPNGDVGVSATLSSLVLPDHDSQGTLRVPSVTLRLPAITRPAGPRRAHSAQDALGTRARIAAGLSGSPASPQEEDASEASESWSEAHASQRPPTPLPPEPITFASPAFAMYENAIEDDVDDEDMVEPSSPVSWPTGYESTVMDDTLAPGPTEKIDIPHPALAGGLVDEGDLLPSNVLPQIESDVTFDDEGLTTLERIFLLCRSEYSFHRAYAARVLGDLLGDVDPCESVEYVLPLVSSFSLDEDESVKEAFAADLHRVLWYFFSACQVVISEDTTQYEATAASDRDDDLSRSSTNMPESVYHLDHVIRTPGSEMPRDKFEAMFAAAAATQSVDDISHSTAATHQATDGGSPRDESPVITEGTSSGTLTSGTTRSTDHVTDSGTALTSVSFPHADEGEEAKPPMLSADSDKLWPGDYEVVEAPAISVDFFRPMLGTLLLSHNPAVADPVRAGIVAIISRLRGHGLVTTETWGSMSEPEDEDRVKTFLSQTGPHAHVLKAFDGTAKSLVEQELLHGIVLGMGTLSTDVPESLFDNSVEVVGDDDEEYTIDRARDEELFRQQMVHEAALGRALSLSLIGSVSEMYPATEVEQYGFVDEVIRGLDGDVNLRAEAAVAMAAVVKAAPEEAIDRLLPVFELYANDEDDQVRQAACVCLAPLCKRIPQDAARRHFAVQAMTTFMASGDSVRYAALEVLGEVIYTFHSDPEGPPAELISIFCDDQESDGKDCDWDVVASYNFPGVCLTLGSDRWSELRDLFKRIVERAGEGVFRTISAFLHELARILNPESVAEDILPVYHLCLELGDDVRERIFEHIDVLISRLPPALGWQSFLHLSNSWKEDQLGGWRAREQLALHIPSFLETFREHDEVALVLHMMRSALLDKFAAVRDAATYAIPKTYDIVQRSHCSATTFYDMLLEFSHSPRFRQRLTFVRCLREFMRPPPNKRAFEQFFMPALVRLATDILDVRLGLAGAVADLFIIGAFYGDKSIPIPSIIRGIVEILLKDESVDVRNALCEIGVDRWANTDSSVTAGEVLASEMAATDSPGSLIRCVTDALSDGPPDDERVASPHNRAEVPSPALPAMPQDQSDLQDNAGIDPFSESFVRAQISGVMSARSVADDILAAAHRAVTFPEGLEGSPPLSPTLPGVYSPR